MKRGSKKKTGWEPILDFIFSKEGTKARRCRLCGHDKRNHKAGTFHCPIGGRTRIGFIHFHHTDTFKPVIRNR